MTFWTKLRLRFALFSTPFNVESLLKFIMTTFQPSMADWVKVTNFYFGEDIDQFKYEAYQYRIKAEAEMADVLGIGDAYRYGSETAKAEQEALAAAKGQRKLPSGLVALGKSREERMLERDDLLITNMVKKVAKESGTEIPE